MGVAVAGRVMTRRVMGKLAFFTLADETGTIQLFLEKAGLEAQQEGWFKQITSLVDSGDWLGVRGTLRRTDRGELSVKVTDWCMFAPDGKTINVFKKEEPCRNGCGVAVTPEGMAAHAPVCAMRLVPCRHTDCNARVPLAKMKEHECKVLGKLFENSMLEIKRASA